MKNPIMDYALAGLGVRLTTSEKLDTGVYHFYELINDQNIPLLWKQIVGHKNVRAVNELVRAQERWSQLPNQLEIVDSVWFLGLVDADTKLINALLRQDITTVTELIGRIKNQGKLPTLWKKTPKRNAEIIIRYQNWKDSNLELLERELLFLPQEDLSTALQAKQQLEAEEVRLMKWLGMESKQLPQTLMEFLKMNFNQKNILTARLSGKTLQEIGESVGLTRERVRQIVVKTVERLPLFDDVEKYKKLISEYDVQVDEFLNYTHGTREVFEYCQLKYKRSKELKSLDQYLLAMKKVAPEDLTERLDHQHKFINHNNQIVELAASNVIDEILFNDRSLFNYETVLEQLNPFYACHNLEAPKLSKHALVSQAERSQHIIQRTNGYFRYYEFDLDDVMDYIHELNALFEVADGIYGIDYFFEQNQALMQEIGILAGAELANLLKQIGYQHFNRLNTIVRQSQVYVGTVQHNAQSKDQFYLKILAQFDHHSIDEVASYLEQSFNLKRNTAWVYISATYTKYIHHNQIDMDAKLPTASSFYEKAKTLFDEPLYPYEQVVAMIQAIDPKVQLSPVLIDKLGYVERSGLVMSKTCDSLDDASKKLWLMDDYVLVDKIKTYPNRWFTFKLYHHELAHNLIAMDETRYLTSTGLEKLGISKIDIENFLQEVLASVTNDVFFTWKSLIDAGFESDFVKRTKFNDYAYIRLIFTIPSIRTIQTNGSVFINQSQPTPKCPPLVAFLAQELGDVSRDIDEFIAELNHKFDLDLDRAKILEKVNKSDLACSLETNCIYPSQTRMYDEVYQEIGI